MIIYEITAKVQKSFVVKFEKFMREKHIPDLLATEHFIGAEMARFLENGYRIRYEAVDKTSLDEYFNNDAKRLRDEFLVEFPEGIEVSREILGVLQSWRKN